MDPWAQWANNITSASGGAGSNIDTNYAQGQQSADMTPQAQTGKVAAVQATTDNIVQANAAKAAAIQEKQLTDAKDPSKAQMTLLPDNKGYAFYDGTGKQIGINQFSLLTGKTPAQLLANSPNPKDQKFVQDYNTLQALSSAWVNGDTKTLDKMRAADPNKFNSLISTYKSPADMVQGFVKHWSDYYTPNQNTQTATNPSFSPQNVNAPTKAQSGALAASTLPQVLTPQPAAPPQESFWNKLNPFSAPHQAVNNYNNSVSQNPWFAYHNSLYGQ